MLLVKEDKKRNVNEGQIFVELTRNRDLSIVDCDRLGYWCDKAHLEHFIIEAASAMSLSETMELFRTILKRKGMVDSEKASGNIYINIFKK